MGSAQAPPALVRFDGFEADLRAGELRRNGVRVRLQDLPFRALTLLLSRPGEVITREEFRQALWPADIFVDFEQGISSAVMRLRDALRDSADNPVFIETIERRGYRGLPPGILPAPDSANVNVDKIGSAVVADPAPMQFQGGIAQLGSRHAGKPDIYRFRLHVQTVLGDSGVRAARTQKLIRAWSSIPADDINLGRGTTEGSGQVVQQVKHPWIVMVHIAGAIVAQVLVEAVERLWQVCVAAAVDDVESLIGMDVVEPQAVFGDRRRVEFRSRRRNQSTERKYKANLLYQRLRPMKIVLAITIIILSSSRQFS
jgi:hypothetical protein